VRAVRSLRDHGATERYVHARAGWCSRLDGLQAAWLQVKLAHLEAWTASRRRLAELYRRILPPGLLVGWEDGAVHHLLVVRVPAAERERIRGGLAERGIQTGLHYPRALSQQPWLGDADGSCPEAELAASEVVSLPMDPLMEVEEVDAVAEALVSVLG
jgi:dTDP-4-amino-4,6-dideoxygalactose transaminase